MKDYLVALIWFCDDYCRLDGGWKWQKSRIGIKLHKMRDMANKYLFQWFGINDIYLHFRANAFGVKEMDNIRHNYSLLKEKYV
jgi:hypothetical protein